MHRAVMIDTGTLKGGGRPAYLASLAHLLAGHLC